MRDIMSRIFELDSYLCRRKVMALVGKISVMDSTGAVVAFSRQKAFKLREEIRVFTDESETTPLLTIKARSIIDFAATYDVTAAEGVDVGSLRRKGFKSMFKDQWMVQGPGDSVDGSIDEAGGTGLALARRFVPFVAWFLTQDYTMTANGSEVATFQRNRNPFVSKLAVQLAPRITRQQRTLAFAAAVLMLIIEGKESSD
jgi:hypothetical protein